MGKVLGVDYGDRWFGLALSDPSRTLARPLTTVRGEDGFFSHLETLMAEEEIDAIVVGLPRNMDGSLGPKAEAVLEFTRRLEERTGLDVETWDERLTTVQAERALKSAGMTLSKRRQRVDQVAAQILLQSFLDGCSSGS